MINMSRSLHSSMAQTKPGTRMSKRARTSMKAPSLKAPSLHNSEISYDDDVEYCRICRLKGRNLLSWYFCVTCNIPLCRSCNNQHTKTEVTKGHKIVPRKEDQRGIPSKMCNVHRFAASTYFCNTCSQLICVNCTMIEHKGHDVVDHEEKVEDCQKMLKEAVVDLDKKIIYVRKELQKVDDVERGIRTTRGQVKESINEKVESLQQKLKKNQESLFEELDEYLDLKLDHLGVKKDLLNQRLDDLKEMRMSNDFLNPSTKSVIAFVAAAHNASKTVQNFEINFEFKDAEFAGMNFVLTNNEELGRLETTDDSMMKLKPPMKIRPASASQISVQIDGMNSARSGASSKARSDIECPDTTEVLLNRKKTLLLDPGEAKSWQRVKILHKFKTTQYIQNPVGLGQLSNGKVVIADSENDGIFICDRSGKYQRRILEFDIIQPQGLVIDKEGHIIISTESSIITYQQNWKKVGEIQTKSQPKALALDLEGNLLVNDCKLQKVTFYNAEGNESGKFHTTDRLGNVPDPYNMAAGEKVVALTYSTYGVTHYMKIYGTDGKMLHNIKLPAACHGLQMDNIGNMLIAAGDICFSSGTGPQTIIPLSCMTKSRQLFNLKPHCIAFTPYGQIITIHINPTSQRSELVFLKLG